MKKYTFFIPGTTSAVKHYMPIPDAGKLAGIYAVNGTAQTTGVATVTAGKKSADHVLYTATVGVSGSTTAAGTVAKGVLNADATDAERAQIFDATTPIELTVTLIVAGSVGVTLLVDEYAVGGQRP